MSSCLLAGLLTRIYHMHMHVFALIVNGFGFSLITESSVASYC